jgi:transposase
MEKELQRSAKGQMVALMQAGHPWQEAAAMAGVQIGRSAAYQLLRNVRLQGEVALQDGRHGRPAKLCEPVRQWLETTCRQAPHTPSRLVQAALLERFGIVVSIGHLNRIRATLGVGSHLVHREKNFDSPARRRTLPGRKGQVASSS